MLGDLLGWELLEGASDGLSLGCMDGLSDKDGMRLGCTERDGLKDTLGASDGWEEGCREGALLKDGTKDGF